MALKSLYLVCEIKKLELIFSSFSVRSQNHSYKNSIVFRLARHFVLKHITSICLDVHTYVILYFDPGIFVLVRLPVPSQTLLNRIFWFINHYPPYHPRNTKEYNKENVEIT